MRRPPLAPIIARAARWKCPRCGLGPLFAGLVRMHRRCPACGLSYYPESGFYLGGMILNYILTVWIIVGAYLLSLLFPDLPELIGWSTNAKIMLWMILAVALSLAMWRHCQSLWLALNYWVEPHDPDSPA